LYLFNITCILQKAALSVVVMTQQIQFIWQGATEEHAEVLSNEIMWKVENRKFWCWITTELINQSVCLINWAIDVGVYEDCVLRYNAV
jgi:hypothetical protein